jgi:hypothetical protein
VNIVTTITNSPKRNQYGRVRIQRAFFPLSLAGLGFFFALGVNGLGGVFRSRSNVSSSRERGSDKYESPISLPDEFFRLLGIIAVHWERLEFVLELSVAEIGSHDPHDVGLLTGNIGFQSKIDLILAYASMLKEEFPNQHREIKVALQAVRDAYALRNTYIHARWIPPAGPHPAKRSVTRTKGGKITVGNMDTSEADLLKAAKVIWDAMEKWIAVMQQYGMLQFAISLPDASLGKPASLPLWGHIPSSRRPEAQERQPRPSLG